jgi:3-deoxy-D-manno-octulosonic-acid transferase
MLHTIYQILVLCAGVVLLPIALGSALLRGYRVSTVFERLGFYGQVEPVDVVVHCSSVGEINAAAGLIRQLEKLTKGRLAVSVMTPTGRILAEQKLAGIRIVSLPYDFGPIVAGFFRVFSPRLLVLFETELWPGLITAAHNSGAQIALVNGRLSERAFARQRRVAWFFRPYLEMISRLLMRSEDDARRIIALGAPADNIRVCGNIKFDAVADPAAIETEKLFAGRRVFVAGSTHPGENGLVVTAFIDATQVLDDLLLLLAPRHLEKIADAAAALDRAELRWQYRSRLEHSSDTDGLQAILLDTHGELAALYRVGEVCFVGGSLVDIGGHNILEVMAVGRPVLFGPQMQNFEIEATLAKESGAGLQVANGKELAVELARLLNEPDKSQSMGLAGLDALKSKRGATAIYLQELQQLLENRNR